MSKPKRMKRKRGSVSFKDEEGEQIADSIKSAAHRVSEASQAYKLAWMTAFTELAEVVGYANLKEAAELIMEEVGIEIEEDTAQGWEKCLRIYVRRKQIDWCKEELEAEIKELEAKRTNLDKA